MLSRPAPAHLGTDDVIPAPQAAPRLASASYTVHLACQTRFVWTIGQAAVQSAVQQLPALNPAPFLFRSEAP